MSQRTIFLLGNDVAEISMCDPEYCDEWCRIRGFDSWVAASIEVGAPLRMVEEGDKLVAPPTPEENLALDAEKATATRAGVEFVKNGAEDVAKVILAQKAAEAVEAAEEIKP